MNALEFRRLIEDKGKLDACKLVNPACSSEDQANALILSHVNALLQANRYAPAAVLLWGETLFSPRPECVRRVWKAINYHNKVLIMGAGSQGKSYTGVIWTELDWIADPEYTTVKLISTTGGHAKSNTYSTIVSLHRHSVCPLPGIVRAESIAVTESDKRACISIVRIREGENNSGVLQGFHPLPRPTPHPTFGASSRVRAVLDEAEDIPNGVWGGIDNMAVSMNSETAEVKIMGFFNPKDISSKTAQLAEPRGGWSEFDIETGVRGKDEWISREGWYVVRLDAKKSENVRERRMIYGGFQTYEGFKALERKDGGNSLSLYTYGRGCYPPDSALCTVVPQRVMDLMRGEMIFSGPTIKLGAADIAIDGRDDAVFAAGRLGRASGLRRLDISPSGEYLWKTTKFPEDRQALQLDQIFNLPKGSHEIVGKAIKQHAIALGIAPEWMMMDATGNGSPVWNYLKIPEVWSPNVKGIDFGQPATETKILNQDSRTCAEQFEGIHTEVWFALARWAELGYFCVSPNVRAENLERELIGRRYLLGKGEKMKVEKKEVYKQRLGRSPDNADTATILVHCARMGGTVIASMTGVVAREEWSDMDAGHGIVDRVEWFNPKD